MGNITNPDTAYLFYDDLGRVAQNFTKGEIATKFSVPVDGAKQRRRRKIRRP